MRRVRPFSVSRVQSWFRCLCRLPSASPARAVTFKYLLQHSALSTAATSPLDLPVGNGTAAQSAETGGADGKHLRVCVVGSGPAGFYVTKYLLKEEAELRCGITVDVIDRLPVPFGLVRFGVAPDHPEVKAVQNDFDQVASDPRVNFVGNVCLGNDVSVAQLSELYDVVVLAYGAAGDRELTVPGAHLKGVFAARAFVSWYNGHPDFAHMSEEFRAALSSSDTVAVVGVGNVALDCARILAKGADALRDTDICEHTLDVLSSAGAGIRRVLVLGRRGHVQASFTIKELRELTKIDGAGCLVRPDELELGRTPASLAELKATRPKNRIDALLTKVSEGSEGASAAAKAVELRFLVGLSEILPSQKNPTRVGSIRAERNRLQLDPATGAEHAVGSGGASELLDCGMVLGSIGYRCLPVDGVPYDDRESTIANEGGRVKGVPGMYCSGWARRGPSGIIGTNITDARSVVAAIVEDITREQQPFSGNKAGRQGLLSTLKGGLDPISSTLREAGSTETAGAEGVQIVDWEGYRKIDRDEVARGATKGKPREKLVDIIEMLKIAEADRGQ